MRTNKTYKGLVEKSVSSMLSAIEIYNKPNFQYREETFAILAINSWELLFKAYILRFNQYDKLSIYDLQATNNRKKKIPQKNRCGNPKSISITKAIGKLKSQNQIPANLEENINSLIELRDNAIHFITPNITKPVQELGFACIKNYVTLIKKWKIGIDLSKYNLYLMPLAYIDTKVEIDSVLTSETKKYLDFIQSKIKDKDDADKDFDIVVSIDVKFKKGNSFDAIGMKYDNENGVPIMLSEENTQKDFPLKYNDVVAQCKERYINFSKNNDFNGIMKDIKKNNKLHYERKLDPNNKKTQKQSFYSSNIWKELDKQYDKIAQSKDMKTEIDLFYNSGMGENPRLSGEVFYLCVFLYSKGIDLQIIKTRCIFAP